MTRVEDIAKEEKKPEGLPQKNNPVDTELSDEDLKKMAGGAYSLPDAGEALKQTVWDWHKV